MDRVTAMLDGLGGAALVVAAFLVHVALGFAVLGILLLVLSWTVDPDRTKRRR